MAKYDTLIVDGSSYLFRAYHALPNLTNKDGQPTGAIYGVINMLMKLRRSQNSEHFLVVFDAPGKNFRHELYPDYKANRGSMPEDLACQIEPLHTIIRHMGWPLIAVPEVEADDVIATVAKAHASRGQRVLISTGDKDLAQLVSENIHLINTMKDEVLDIDGVVNKFGVHPSQILDYLMLIGDSSDNIPGVNKVGPKTAVKWLTTYGSLEKIIEHADQIKGVVGQNLRDCMAQFEWTRELVRLKDNLSLSLTDADMQMASANNMDLQQLFIGLDFNRWANEIKDKEQPVKLLPVSDLSQFPEYSFDKDSAILLTVNDKVVVMTDKVWIGDSLDNVLKRGTFTFLDAKNIFKTTDQVFEVFEDVHLLQYVVDSSMGDQDLLVLIEAQTGQVMSDKGQDVLRGEFSQMGLSEMHDRLWSYVKSLREQMDEGMRRTYELEKQVLPVILSLEATGVHINKEKLEKLDAYYADKMKELQETIYNQTGSHFNLQSPKQLREVLFDKLNLPVIEKTAKGIPSTSEATLTELAKTVPVANDILTYRMFAKLKSTYSEALLQLMSEQSRVHGDFLQTGTNTGRLSSRHPNLQNIPVKTEEGRKIRQCFEATAGNSILAIDYSQIELRLVAHLAQDEQLINALIAGEDIHAAVASRIFEVSLDDVDASMRRKAKAINFGIIYGISPFGLSRQLDVSPKEAKEIIDAYFERFSNIQTLMNQSIEEAKKHGYVRTTNGRRIKILGIQDRQAMRRQAANRVAINAPIQGMAADIMKLAMVRVSDYLKHEQEAKLVLQVHDELVFEVTQAHCERVGREIAAEMEKVVQLSVPLIVSIGRGENWDEAH